MTSLSLVMIVKDEGEILPGFLAHHESLADEIVIVDTGSSDGTDRIALDSGALVVDHRWNDDFAAARNAGLEEARGDWVLFLDADERVARVDFDSVREALPLSRERVYLMNTLNYCHPGRHLEWRPVSGAYPQEETGQTGYYEARRIGLFPRMDRLRFTGRIHESVLPSVERLGLAVESLNVPVHHFGFVLSEQRNRARKDRDLKLAARKLEETPDDPAALLENAALHLETGEPERAEDLLRRVSDGPSHLRPVVRGRCLLARIQREKGEFEEAENLLRSAREGDPAFVPAWVESIRLAAVQDRWISVDTLLAEARGRCAESDPLLLQEELRCLVKTGRLERARELAAGLVDSYPGWMEIRTILDRLIRLQGGPPAP